MNSTSAGAHFLSRPDLAARPAGGAVLWANDDLFAEKENLIKPGPAEHRPATFGHKGQVYDGWETRRRRGVTGDAHDAAIVRLSVPAVVRLSDGRMCGCRSTPTAAWRGYDCSAG